MSQWLHVIVLVLVLSACHGHRGNLDERCNADGTCNVPGLTCQSHIGGWGDYVYDCLPKPPASSSVSRCSYESECFCVTCADKCGDAGVKQCAYSDTSVWGAKPAVCECK